MFHIISTVFFSFLFRYCDPVPNAGAAYDERQVPTEEIREDGHHRGRGG